MLAFENMFRNVPQGVKYEVMELWKQGGALLDDQTVVERLNQVVFVIRDSETGKLAGVSTAEKKIVKALNNNYFYEFRCFISEQFRVAGLDIKLSKITVDYLETISVEDANSPIGVFAILENEILKNSNVWRKAVWPETEMYFVGYTNSGDPIRVRYFKGARI